MKPFREVSIDEWDEILMTNLRGPFLCIREALKSMLPRKSGVIINVSSGFGTRAFPNFTAYCASKFGLEGFTRSLAIEIRPFGIRVNTLHPGGVANTAMGAATAPRDLPEDQWLAPDILCEPAIFLASEEGRNVSGQCVNAKDWHRERRTVQKEFR